MKATVPGTNCKRSREMLRHQFIDNLGGQTYITRIHYTYICHMAPQTEYYSYPDSLRGLYSIACYILYNIVASYPRSVILTQATKERNAVRCFALPSTNSSSSPSSNNRLVGSE